MLGSFFEEQARALQRLGHQTGIIYPDYHPPSALFSKMAELPLYTDDNGLPTYSINVRTFLPKMRSANYKVHGMVADRLFKKYVKRFGMPDIIHSHSANHAGIAAIYLSEKYNLPHILTEHLTTLVSHSIKNKYDFKLTRKIFRSVEKALVVSHVFKDALVDALKLHPAYFEVVHNMVNDLFFENFKPKSYNQNEDFVFFTNSFLKKRKNHMLLFDALKILIDKGYKVKLKVGGYGEEAENLKLYVKQLQLENNITFSGILNRKQVKEEMESSHAFALTSLYETFGIVLIESLACGRPVISTDSKGPRDIITPENGLLVENFEAVSFASAMEQMIINYDTYNQKNISENCRNNFSELSISNRLLEIYQSAIASRKKNIVPIKQKEEKKLLITFDYELFLGKRSGSIANNMINPTAKLLVAMQPYNIKAIFFVDTTYLIRLKEQAQNTAACKTDLATISTQIQLLIKEGHYVFPHIHTHWIDAKYIKEINEWNVEDAKRYRFNAINQTQRDELFRQSITILKEIIEPVKPGYKLDTFRAGGWSIQPFSDFKSEFIKHKISYDFSVLDKAYQFTEAQYYDFSNRPDKLIYKFDYDECIESPNGDFTEFVNSTIELNTEVQLKHRIYSKINRSLGIEKEVDTGWGQVGIKQLSGIPKSESGFPASGAGRFYLSVDLMSKAYLPVYKDFLRDNYYMHFVSHPKLISQNSLKKFEDFLSYAFENFNIETDFRKMEEK